MATYLRDHQGNSFPELMQRLAYELRWTIRFGTAAVVLLGLLAR